MAKIITRSNHSAEEATIQRLQQILDVATQGVISTRPSSVVYAGDDIKSLLDNVESALLIMNRTANNLVNENHRLKHENVILILKLDQAVEILESFANVSYDEALDHATSDLMDAFAASGSADVTANGELGFNENITFSKGDLKPILREAICRYLEMKLS